MDYDFDEFTPGYDDEDYEVIGSCDECECDIDEEDCYILGDEQYCGQCYWRLTGGDI